MRDLGALMEKARRGLQSTRLLLDDGDGNGAANRLYYAMFHAVNAALESRGVKTKTHAGALQQFSLNFVKNGPLDRKFGSFLERTEQLRTSADYRDEPVSVEIVREQFPEAVEFINELTRLLDLET